MNTTVLLLSISVLFFSLLFLLMALTFCVHEFAPGGERDLEWVEKSDEESEEL